MKEWEKHSGPLWNKDRYSVFFIFYIPSCKKTTKYRTGIVLEPIFSFQISLSRDLLLYSMRNQNHQTNLCIKTKLNDSLASRWSLLLYTYHQHTMILSVILMNGCFFFRSGISKKTINLKLSSYFSYIKITSGGKENS